MTGLSIALSGLFRRYHRTGTPMRFGVHPLSTFLMYHNLSGVYRMIHVLIRFILSHFRWFAGTVRRTTGTQLQ
jgi:hypothetical protein